MAHCRSLMATLAAVLAPAVIAHGQPAEPSAPQAPAEPSLPENPTSPLDFQAAGTLPAARGASKAESEAAPAREAPTGYSGGDMVIGDSDSPYGRSREGGFRGPIPKYHTVRQGDTLWGVCNDYYGDPWMWPKLWANNQSITNPHWIYPGDKIQMVGGSGRSRRRLYAMRGGSMRVSGRRDEGPRTIVLQQNGFIDLEARKSAGEVVGSKRESRLLSEQDEAYVRLQAGAKMRLKAGRSYSVYAVRHPLKRGKETLGYVVEIMGAVRIKSINDKGVATVVITKSRRPIERGALVGPLRRTYRRMELRPADRSLKAKLIAQFRTRKKLIGTNELVFIDRGARDGVKLGNRFLVTRRGDGYRTIIVEKYRDDPTFPREVVAEVSVLDLRANTAVGLVTRARKELLVGEDLELRRGY